MTTAQDGGTFVRGNAPGTHFCLEAESTQGHSTIGRILCQWKIPMTPAGIEPTIFRFVAQHRNHCATAVPQNYVIAASNTSSQPFMICMQYVYKHMSRSLWSAGISSWGNVRRVSCRAVPKHVEVRYLHELYFIKCICWLILSLFYLLFA